VPQRLPYVMAVRQSYRTFWEDQVQGQAVIASAIHKPEA
jgi:hypothetical protein